MGIHNIPVYLTTFVGRQVEVAATAHLLTTTRLLTLTGPGGSGKTRLAVELALYKAEAFADGVWWVDLVGLVDDGLVPQAVAHLFGLQEEAQRPLTETLAAALRPQQALLVLDNCEHLVDACAQLVDALLRAGPQLQVLATSREVLGVAGEVVRLVPSLSLPLPHTPAPTSEDEVPALLQYDAMRLFVERAQAVLPNFALTTHNAATVMQITRRLDGMPLAIELAAARVKMLTVKQIAHRLDSRFNLLTADGRTVLPQH